jgi:uncharacterized protein (DUF433 family)
LEERMAEPRADLIDVGAPSEGAQTDPARVLEARLAIGPPLRVDPDGVVRVGGTRVPLETIVESYRNGASPEEIVLAYDSLDLGDVHAAVGFYVRYKEEVEAYLRHREVVKAEMRRQNQERSPLRDVRDRLLARRARAA